ncbi:vascular endothelial growth factor C-like isoform X2 [Amblyraja radiata]|uniref:vascular endothelial growth factor C-like isoform X2 n=1 Tax=Amblyraja radiata TaxID=386614 RepID=UPI001402FE83|nr:vascular endothelial growth factor C-like isoform X2 [Amblyraja radiata]
MRPGQQRLADPLCQRSPPGYCPILSLSLILLSLLTLSAAHQPDHPGHPHRRDQAHSQGQATSQLEQQLRSAANIIELMDIFYPEYRRIQECLQRRSTMAKHARREAEEEQEEEEEWTEAAAFTVLWREEDLRNIELEWERTQCKPREVCLDLGRELGTATNKFYKPPCVSVHRCGGCCNNEGFQCINVSTAFLMEITIPQVGLSRPVVISFINHTACGCHPRHIFSQSHSIIRRSFHVSPTSCVMGNETCPHGHRWDPHHCRCVSVHEVSTPPTSTAEPDVTEGEFDDFCGPYMVFDEDSCNCVCTNWPSSCHHSKEFDENTCRCVCVNRQHRGLCREEEQEEWDDDACQCVCRKSCPRHLPLNTNTCTCECSESPESCFRRGKKFDPYTCRCYRLPCRSQVRQCQPGLYFSHFVCSCLPLYMKEYQTED